MFFIQQQQQNVNIPCNSQQQQNVNMLFNGQQEKDDDVQSMNMPDDYMNDFLHSQDQFQLQHLPLPGHSPPTLSPSYHNIIHHNYNPRAQSFFRTQPPQHTQILMQQQHRNVQMQIQQQNLQTNNLQIQLQQDNGNNKNMHMQILQDNGSMALNAMKEFVLTSGSATPTPKNGEKKKRGRPRNTPKNECNTNSSGAFTPPLNSTMKFKKLRCDNGGPGRFQVIIVAPGEDVSQKIMAFWQQIPSTIVIISANGTVSNVNFRDPLSGGIANHKGEFEILSLSRSYAMQNDVLRATLIQPDGRIFWGAVAGLLVAASHVEVVVGMFPCPLAVPGQVGSKKPNIDKVKAYTFESPSSIAGQSKSEVCSTTNTSQGLLQNQQLQNRMGGVQIEANGRMDNVEIT
ncbi:hypothetical protein KI387_015539, partial [Taxus chinensis]